MHKQQGCSIGAALFCVIIRRNKKNCFADYELLYVDNILLLNIIF